MKELLVGVDIGTSAIKAALFDLDGSMHAATRVPYSVNIPEPGWAEQDPQDWLVGTQKALRDVLAGVDVNRVQAVGLSGQCPSHVLINRDGCAMGPAIIWRDQRAQDEAEWMRSQITQQQAIQWTGSPMVANASIPPARLLWMKKHRANDWKIARWVLEPKDFIGLWLTNNVMTDIYTAYCLVNSETGFYDPEYFKLLEIPIEILPPVHSPTTILGEVSKEAAVISGLKAGIPVVIGTIDAWCDNLAGGALFDGQGVDVAGTSEIISLGVVKEADQSKGVFLAKIGDSGSFLCGPTQAGGDTLRWYTNAFYPEKRGNVLPFEFLESEALQVPPGCDGLVFFPYLNGERAPIWDSQIRGGFIGLTLAHDRRYCTRAVYEGVGYAVRHVLETCEKAADTRANKIIICGGGSRSTFWNQIKADILQRQVVPALVSESACLGAAILASVSLGRYHNLLDACRAMIHFNPPINPNQTNCDRYEINYQFYVNMYPSLSPQFR